MTFFQDYKWVILFYSLIILLVFIFRKKFEIHNKFLAMYHTKVGLKLMDKLGTKYSEIVKLLGYIGIGAGYIGLFFIAYYLLNNLWSLISTPSAVSAISVVIPGVKIPGSPITIPLITGWIALFVVVLVHEFSHGVVARAHGIKVKSSGIFFMGPLMGAFVEPDEKALRKQKDTVQYSVYAAGPFSNILLALVCLFLLTYAVAPGIHAMTNEVGVDIVSVTDNMPAKEANLTGGMVITAVNGEDVKNYNDFTTMMRRIRSNETVTITANNTVYNLVTIGSPDDKHQGYLGVMASSAPKTELKSDATYFNILYAILKLIAEILSVTGILSFGIGLANLLPLGPVDGGRMLQVTLEKIKGAEKGNVIWKKISIITLIILAINIFWPAIKWIGKLFT